MAVRYRASAFVVAILVVAPLYLRDASAWSLKTHVLIAQKAGMQHPETATFTDFAKKDNESLLGPFHWHDAAPNTVVTPEYIEQYKVTKEKYVKLGEQSQKPIEINVPHPSGVLYWKITDLYQKLRGAKGWEREYYLSVIAHLIGDLSQPLHNFPYGSGPASDGKIYADTGGWSKTNHRAFDEALDHYLPLDSENEKKLTFWIIPLKINTVDDLKQAISHIANNAIAIANRCYNEDKRPMTGEETLMQCALSISLLKAVIASTQQPSGTQ